MATTVQPLAGTYELDPHHSTVQFAVRHQQMSTFRASFTDIEARLTLDGGTITLEGEARVESVTIAEPLEFREHVVRGADFLDADAHPITARGTYHPPREDPFGSQRAGLELRANVDRRTWDMNWQLPLPDGSDALGWDVEITAQLELIKKD